MLQLQDLLHRRPAQLSGGQRQRVAMGRAIVRDADVFLYDEPLSNLDAKLRNQMRYEIRRIHREYQTTSIYVTHDQVEAMDARRPGRGNERWIYRTRRLTYGPLSKTEKYLCSHLYRGPFNEYPGCDIIS